MVEVVLVEVVDRMLKSVVHTEIQKLLTFCRPGKALAGSHPSLICQTRRIRLMRKSYTCPKSQTTLGTLGNYRRLDTKMFKTYREGSFHF